MNDARRKTAHFFIDTEFSEDGADEPIYLLSIGIKAADGRTFYAVNEEWRTIPTNSWVAQNVVPHLLERNPLVASLSEIREAVRGFIGDVRPEFWGYYAAYDWVVFCQMFGAMVDLPKGWPMYCRDLKQWCDALGNPKLPEQYSTEHNALADAEWNAEVYGFLAAHAADAPAHDDALADQLDALAKKHRAWNEKANRVYRYSQEQRYEHPVKDRSDYLETDNECDLFEQAVAALRSRAHPTRVSEKMRAAGTEAVKQSLQDTVKLYRHLNLSDPLFDCSHLAIAAIEAALAAEETGT